MALPFSRFLDALRLTAAFIVFLGHYSYERFSDGLWVYPNLPIHGAVIVFFVLSGYVIAWTAAREATGLNYAINRTARIYSVAIPALFLTYIIDSFVNPAPPIYQLEQPWKYFPLFLFFATEFWFLSEAAFSNAPYWSLSYEVWYYALYGVFIFGGRKKWIWLIAILAMIGPRHWVLLPVWGLGAVIFHYQNRIQISVQLARWLLAGVIGCIIALKCSGFEMTINTYFNNALSDWPKTHLRYSQYFLGDYIFASLIGLLIIAGRKAEIRLPQGIAQASSVSFSLYLVHYPLLILFAPLEPAQTLICSLLGSILFGIIFEHRKHVWRSIIAQTLQAGLRSFRLLHRQTP